LLLKSDIAAFIRREAPFILMAVAKVRTTGDDGTGTNQSSRSPRRGEVI